MRGPIFSRQCDPVFIVSSRGVCWLRLALLLGLVLHLQIRPIQGQSQQGSLCTTETRPVLLGLGGRTSTPADGFGHDTSLSQNGTIAAIGATDYRNVGGIVQVFRFENNSWTQLGRTIFGADFEVLYGTNALSDGGSILAVAGWNPSRVRAFRLVDDDWEPLGNNITHPNGKFQFGAALAFSGDGTILAVSSPKDTGLVGEVQVFELVGNMWSQKGRILQGQGEDEFGGSLSLSQDGSRLAVGIPDYTYSKTNGFVRVFEFIDNDWVQIGQTIQGTNVGVSFGGDVSFSSDGRTLAVGSSGFSDESSYKLGSVRVYRFGSDGQWFEPGAMLIGKFAYEEFGRSLALSGDASILVASGDGFLRFFAANGTEWIEVGEETTNSNDYNCATISRDGSTAMGGASGFDLSCQEETTPDTSGNSIAIIVGAFIGIAVLLVIAVIVVIQAKQRKKAAWELVRALQRSGTPVESQDHMSAQHSSSAVGSHGQSPPSAAGLVVYDEWGEALAPRTVAAQAVLLESDNFTRLQNNSTKVQASSAGSLKPSSPKRVTDTPLPEPTAVSTPSDGYVVQFKDQARYIEAPDRCVAFDP